MRLQNNIDEFVKNLTDEIRGVKMNTISGSMRKEM